jgi:hypothetical protein
LVDKTKELGFDVDPSKYIMTKEGTKDGGGRYLFSSYTNTELPVMANAGFG